MRKHIQDTWRSLKADSLQWHQPIVAVSGGSNAQRDLSDLLSSLRCAALHLDSVSGMLSPPLLQPVAVQSLKAFWWAWQCVGLFLFYTKGWSYASFEGNSLLCNQTPLFHNHSTLTVAHPLHSTRSDQTEKHTYKYGALPAVAWFFIQLGMCTIVWLVFWNLFEHNQKMRPLFWGHSGYSSWKFLSNSAASEAFRTQDTDKVCWCLAGSSLNVPILKASFYFRCWSEATTVDICAGYLLYDISEYLHASFSQYLNTVDTRTTVTLTWL